MVDLQKFLDELRSKVSIADVVGGKVKLVRKGREFLGLCPFHNEKTPSFTVNEAKGFYHCFGCGAHGDIVKFEMEANGLPFMDAITKLAHKAGVPLPAFSKEHNIENEKKNSQYDIMEQAAKFFEKNLHLTGGRKALDYLYNRGFDDGIITKFRIGYAPNNNGLKAQLSSKGISENEMVELGLASVSESKTGQESRVFDFFRDRVIIPIMDKRGRVIGFGGRILGDGQPKYLNSPDTPVFNKRRILYNYHYARDKAYDAKTLVICEGYMDVIALDKFGFSYAVAPLGTALTEEQIMEAWKVCPESTLCFDGDSAGVRAAMRSVDRVLPILKAGYSLKYAFLPDKLDPDDFLKAKGSEAFASILKDTKPLSELLWLKNLEGKAIETPEQKALFEKNLYEDVAKITDEKVRGYYLQEIKARLYNEFGRAGFTGSGGKRAGVSGKAKVQRPKIRDDFFASFFLAALVAYPELISEYEEKLSMFEIGNSSLQKILDALLALYQTHEQLDFNLVNQSLCDKGLKDSLKSLWELEMLRQQKPYINDLRKEIDRKILEAQLKLLEAEIRECRRVMETNESLPEEIYERLSSLQKERNALLEAAN